MDERLQHLVALGRQELDHIDRAIADVEEIAALVAAAPTDRVRVDAAAERLQSLYTGIERCFERIAKVFEGEPGGSDSHRAIVQQMAREYAGLRRAVITADSVKRLASLRASRHAVRHKYAFELKADMLAPVLAEAPATARQVRDEIRAFLDDLTRP